MIGGALDRARRLTRQGEDVAAREAYLALLRLDPTHLAGLTELGALAHDGGYLSAACAAFGQAVQCHPDNLAARIGYADALRASGEYASACRHYRMVRAVDPGQARAHRGLAWALSAMGEDASEHWRAGFVGHAIERRRYRGDGPGIDLLLLAAATGGNVPTQHWIDDRVFRVTAVYADFLAPDEKLPAHALIVNAIGDADCGGEALAQAERIVARSSAPVINPPALVRATGRKANACRLAGLPDVVAPRIQRLSQAELRFPLLLRAAGYHTGQHFLRVLDVAELDVATAALPDGDPLVIDYHETRGPDGLARKYRVMSINGALLPLHLAISPEWKVHYFSAAMASDAGHRREEQRFLDDMPGVLGARAMRALAAIQAMRGLDYAGIDFALNPDGSVLVFEANATMLIHPPAPGVMWDYRRPAAAAAVTAARTMLAVRAGLAARDQAMAAGSSGF